MPDLEAGAHRQRKIQQDDVRLNLLGKLQPTRPIRRLLCSIVLAAQDVGDDRTNLVIIVDDQHRAAMASCDWHAGPGVRVLHIHFPSADAIGI